MATTLSRETIELIEKIVGHQVDVLIGSCGDETVLATSDRARVTDVREELDHAQLGNVALGDVESGRNVRMSILSHDTSTCGCRAHTTIGGELVCIP